MYRKYEIRVTWSSAVYMRTNFARGVALEKFLLSSAERFGRQTHYTTRNERRISKGCVRVLLYRHS